MEFYELRSTVSLQSTMSTNVAIEANLSPRLPTGKIPFLIFFVPQKLKNMLSLSLCYIVRYVIMDFNKFQEWCQNKGFVIKLPSGYVKLINLDVSSFESFKGIFNLCMLFFYEELYKQRENEKEETLNNCIKNFKNSPTILYLENGSTITPLNDSESTVRSNRSIKIKKYRKDIDVKYSDEDFEKTFNYLLTPNENSGIVPMDRLLNYLENKEKYENSESATLVDGEAKRSKSNWCDIGKESREKEYKNSESASSPDGDAELKHWVDRVADKYDSEDSTAPRDVADSASSSR